MKPAANKVKETNDKKRNTYFMNNNRSDFQAKCSHTSNYFLKHIPGKHNQYGKNEYNKNTLPPMSTTIKGTKERALEMGINREHTKRKGNEALIEMDERRIPRVYGQNINVMKKPNMYFNRNISSGMMSTVGIPPHIHPSNLHSIPDGHKSSLQARTMFHAYPEIDPRTMPEQYTHRFHCDAAPMFYEPLKYPAFKMADRLKGEKREGTDTEKEKNEKGGIEGKTEEKEEKEEKEEMEKGNDIKENDVVHGIKGRQEEGVSEKVENIEQEEEKRKKKSAAEILKNQETTNDTLQRKRWVQKTEKIKQMGKEKETYNCEIQNNMLSTKLKCSEKVFNEKSESVDDTNMYTKSASLSGEDYTNPNNESEKMSEFLTVSLNPCNSTINPQDITNEIKFILHMTLLTLYRDQIKPTYRKIKKRLKCFSENFEIKYNFLNMYALLQNQYIVVRSKNNNVFVLLRETPKWFLGWVNTKSYSNIYPKNVWKYFISYLLDISKVKWDYSYSSFLLKFMNYLKTNHLLFYVQTQLEGKDFLPSYGNYSSKTTSCTDANQNQNQNQNQFASTEIPEERIYQCIDEEKSFSFFSYLETFYRNNREAKFCESYISFLKEEKDPINSFVVIPEKMNDGGGSQKSYSASEKWNPENEEREIKEQNEKNKEKEEDEVKEKEEEEEEEMKTTRICYEKHKDIFNPKESSMRDEKNTKKKNKWEFDDDIYEMASFLKKQNFHFLKNYSLGKIAHIIQLSLYNGLLLEEGGSIKPACAIKHIVPAVFYFKHLLNENRREKNRDIKMDIHLGNQGDRKGETQKDEKDVEKRTKGFHVDLFSTSSMEDSIAQLIDEEEEEKEKEKEKLEQKQEQIKERNSSYTRRFSIHNKAFWDTTFNFDYSNYSQFQQSQNEIGVSHDKWCRQKKDVFEQILNDIQEARNNCEFLNVEETKRRLFQMNDVFEENEEHVNIKDISHDTNISSCLSTSSTRSLFSETYYVLKKEQNEQLNSNQEIYIKEEGTEHLKIIKNLEEAKSKIDRLLKNSYKKQIFLYLFRERFCKKYKEVINPLYFGYNSLIEFLFYACKEICKIYILNKNILLVHHSCNIKYLQNKKDSALQPFSYLDYFYSAPEKKKENENKNEKNNKKEHVSSFENQSLEICTIMKDLAKKKNNFLITFHFWKRWGTQNKNASEMVYFLKEDVMKNDIECSTDDSMEYKLFEPIKNFTYLPELLRNN